MASYDEIVSNKSSLEFEINTYRRLLESEEAHVKKINQSSTTIRQTHIHESNYISTSPIRQPSSVPIEPRIDHVERKINQTEMQAKTTFQRSAKGFI